MKILVSVAGNPFHHLLLHHRGQVEVVEQFELWNRLAGLQVVRTEHQAILATNECGDLSSVANITRVPPDLDLISVDIYTGFLPGSPAGGGSEMDEFNLVKARYSEFIFPKMEPHQQVGRF